MAFIVWFVGHRRQTANEPVDVVTEEHAGVV